MIRALSIALALFLAVGCVSPASPSVLHVGSGGEITLNGAAMDRDELPAKLAKETALVIKASPQTPRAAITGVLAAARQAGVRNVSIAPEAMR